MQDIAMHILDIAYNSIRALATNIKIRIDDLKSKNIIQIEIEDNGKGMDKETLSHVTDPFYTTRTTRKVGLGVPLFKEGAIMTGGNFEIQSIVGKGTKISATYVKDHLDTPPLGDLAETLVTLIQADDTIDYYFVYRNDDKEFILDTKEIKNILEDVKINEPEIILWLKDYIKEGLTQ